MTQIEAVVKALKTLGGEGELKYIYMSHGARHGVTCVL